MAKPGVQVGAGVGIEPSRNPLTFECRNPQLPELAKTNQLGESPTDGRRICDTQACSAADDLVESLGSWSSSTGSRQRRTPRRGAHSCCPCTTRTKAHSCIEHLRSASFRVATGSYPCSAGGGGNLSKSMLGLSILAKFHSKCYSSNCFQQMASECNPLSNFLVDPTNENLDVPSVGVLAYLCAGLPVKLY